MAAEARAACRRAALLLALAAHGASQALPPNWGQDPGLPPPGTEVQLASLKWNYVANHDCFGHDLATYSVVARGEPGAQADLEACAKLCEHNERCVAFNIPVLTSGTWDTSTRGPKVCYLKWGFVLANQLHVRCKTDMETPNWDFYTMLPFEAKQKLQHFDCNAGFANWQSGWSAAKKDFCCDTTGCGCEPQTTYDCNAGFENWQAGWSIDKKEWCCKHAGRACEESYDCDAGFAMWKTGWSPQKKVWCCKHAGRGCAPDISTSPMVRFAIGTQTYTYTYTYTETSSTSTWTSTTTTDTTTTFTWTTTTATVTITTSTTVTETTDTTTTATWTSTSTTSTSVTSTATTTTWTTGLDCSAAYNRWQTEWSTWKKKWCCEREGKGCTKTTLPAYDCDKHFDTWQKGWSVGKKAWCCLMEGRACETTIPAPYDCQGALPEQWTEGKVEWCCIHENRGCRTTTTPYDCTFDLPNSVSWSPGKKAWCCLNTGYGCPTSTTPKLYDCDEGLANWMYGWSAGKVEWCCENEDRGCFDCNAGFANWQHGWSFRKKNWCCRNYGRGCMPGGNGGSCDLTQNGGQPYSKGHQEWCCREHQIFCPTTTPIPYDCNAAFGDWRSAWSSGKKAWCCLTTRRGCEGAIS